MDWHTHEVSNQFDEWTDYNLLTTDRPMLDALERAGAQAFTADLTQYAARLGQADTFALGDEANRHTPELKAFDARGRRINQVTFHPSWHALMAMYREQGLIA